MYRNDEEINIYEKNNGLINEEIRITNDRVSFLENSIKQLENNNKTKNKKEHQKELTIKCDELNK